MQSPCFQLILLIKMLFAHFLLHFTLVYGACNAAARNGRPGKGSSYTPSNRKAQQQGGQGGANVPSADLVAPNVQDQGASNRTAGGDLNVNDLGGGAAGGNTGSNGNSGGSTGSKSAKHAGEDKGVIPVDNTGGNLGGTPETAGINGGNPGGNTGGAPDGSTGGVISGGNRGGTTGGTNSTGGDTGSNPNGNPGGPNGGTTGGKSKATTEQTPSKSGLDIAPGSSSSGGGGNLKATFTQYDSS